MQSQTEAVAAMLASTRSAPPAGRSHLGGRGRHRPGAGAADRSRDRPAGAASPARCAAWPAAIWRSQSRTRRGTMRPGRDGPRGAGVQGQHEGDRASAKAAQDEVRASQAAAEQKAALNRMADGFESNVGELWSGCCPSGSTELEGHCAVDDRLRRTRATSRPQAVAAAAERQAPAT